jgi:peroxiredoxin
MRRATAALGEEFATRRLLKVGDPAPDFVLPNAVGEEVRLADRLAAGAVVLTFYRGAWCPYCNLELRAYQEVLPRLEELGASLVAITPETPDGALEALEKNDLAFDVLSDVGSVVARAYRIAFELPGELKALYTELGHVLPDKNGTDDWTLPVPATFVVARTGHIALADVDVDYRNRLDPADAVAALERL